MGLDQRICKKVRYADLSQAEAGNFSTNNPDLEVLVPVEGLSELRKSMGLHHWFCKIKGVVQFEGEDQCFPLSAEALAVLENNIIVALKDNAVAEEYFGIGEDATGWDFVQLHEALQLVWAAQEHLRVWDVQLYYVADY